MFLILATDSLKTLTMKPYFMLRNYEDQNGLQQIQLYYFNKGKKLRLDTGVKTKKVYWQDKHPQKIVSRATEIKQNPDELNTTLGEKMHKLEGIIQDYKRKFNISPDIEYVRTEFYKEASKILNDTEVKKQLEDWILIKAKKVKYIKIFRTVLNDLKEHHPKNLYYRNIDMKFFEGLLEYWMNRKTEKKNGERTDLFIQNSTINKRLKCFKQFLRAKFDTGENEYLFFEKFHTELKPITKPKIVIPTDKEFEILCNKEITKKHLDTARDLYVIACATGLRYSDVVKLTPMNIVKKKGVNYLITDITKTGSEDLLIPLNEVAYTFLMKQFNNGGIQYISNKNLNENLHKMLRELEFTTPTIMNRRSGKDTTPLVVYKCDALSFHSSRKFFVSTCVNSNKINIGNVMSWSGHTNLAVVKSYIQEGHEQEAEMLELFKGIIKK